MKKETAALGQDERAQHSACSTAGPSAADKLELIVSLTPDRYGVNLRR